MTTKKYLTIVGVIFYFVLAVSGCSHMTTAENDIVLDGFSDENYIALDKNIGRSTCIAGTLNIDDNGIYFLLKPRFDGETISPYASRIITRLNYEYAAQNNMKDGRVYKLCGTLRVETALTTCNSNSCKWYVLEDAKL
jgi:hypothetical protein